MISFELSNNLIVVSATINGNDASMILDTGAGKTIISSDAVRRLGLQEAHETCVAGGAGGSVELSSVELDLLAIGKARQREMTVMTMDMSDLSAQLEKKVDGVLGFDFLSNYKITVDYPAQRLSFEGAA